MKTLREMIDIVEGVDTNYRLELLDTETEKDPEDYGDMTVYYFDVYQGDKWVGRANGNDYFSDLYVDIDGKRTELDSERDKNHPLMKQFKQHAWGFDGGDDEELDEEATPEAVEKINKLYQDKQ